MGIRGLTTYCHKNVEDIAERINLTEKALSQGGLTLLVDLCAFYFYYMPRCEATLGGAAGAPSFVNTYGGEYKIFDAFIVHFFGRLKQNGINVIGFLDASQGTEHDEGRKFDTWKTRFESRIQRVVNAQAALCTSVPESERPQSIEWFLPRNWHEQLLSSLSRANVPVRVTIEEADIAMVRAFPKDNAFAIVSSDSDFFVFPGIRYIPFEFFDADSAVVPDAVNRPVVSSCFTAESVASHLNLSASELLEMSFICGNDISSSVIEQVQLVQKLGIRCNSYTGSTYAYPIDVAAWINNLPQGCMPSSLPVFLDLCAKDKDFRESFQKHLNFYRLSETAEDSIHTLNSVSTLDSATKQAITQRFLTGHMPSFTLAVLRHGRLWLNNCVECLFCGINVETVHKPFRQVLYHMLACEQVEERCVDGFVLGSDLVKAAALESIPRLDQFTPQTDKDRLLYTVAHMHFDFPRNFYDDDFRILSTTLTVKSDRSIVYVFRYLISLIQFGFDLTEHEFMSLVSLYVICTYGSNQLIFELLRLSGSSTPPSFRSLIVSTWYQSCLKHYNDLCLLTSAHEFSPDIPRCFSGIIFQYLLRCPNLLMLESILPESLRQEFIGLRSLHLVRLHQRIFALFEPPYPFAEPGSAMTHERCHLLDSDTADLEEALESLHLESTQPADIAGLMSPDPYIEAEEEDDSDMNLPPGSLPAPDTLPIDSHREQIMESIRNRRVTCLQGETGCGKSSMLPQYILKEAQGPVSIIVTQPRRIAAITLAKRVAGQLGEPVGETVGYHIARQSKVSSKTKLLYVTEGYLLQYFSHNPNNVNKFTHIILDEVHERSLDSDLLSLLMKLLVQMNPAIRLVVMSATLQSDLFAQYFADLNEDRLPSAPIFVGVRRFPVDIWYLEDVSNKINSLSAETLKHTQTLLRSFPVSDKGKRSKTPAKPTVTDLSKTCKPEIHQNMYNVAVEIICKLNKAGTCILVFLPGAEEILQLQTALEFLPMSIFASFSIFTLHSSVANEEQENAFTPCPGSCKVILSTNIAESSVTIPDVHYVIDFGLRRQTVLDRSKGITSLVLSWCSQASMKQRAGRAGRLFPGTVLRLIPQGFHDMHLQPFDSAEILRTSLELMVLRVKELFASFGSVTQLLSKTVEPPSTDDIGFALEHLYKTGALTSAAEDAKVTVFGRFSSSIGLNLPLCKLIFLGYLFNSVCDAIVMAAALSMQDLFSIPSPLFIHDSTKLLQELALNFQSRLAYDDREYSEPIMYRNLYVAWMMSGQQYRWAQNESVSYRRMQLMTHLVQDLAGRLQTFLTNSGVHFSSKPFDFLRNRQFNRQDVPKYFNVDSQKLKLLIGCSFAPVFAKGTVTHKAKGDIKLMQQLKLDPKRCMIVRSIPPELLSESKLRELFGPIEGIEKIICDSKFKFAAIQFTSPEPFQSNQAVIMHDLPAGAKVLLSLRSARWPWPRSESSLIHGHQQRPAEGGQNKHNASKGNEPSLSTCSSTNWTMLFNSAMKARPAARSSVLCSADFRDPAFEHLCVGMDVVGTSMANCVRLNAMTLFDVESMFGESAVLLAVSHWQSCKVLVNVQTQFIEAITVDSATFTLNNRFTLEHMTLLNKMRLMLDDYVVQSPSVDVQLFQKYLTQLVNSLPKRSHRVTDAQIDNSKKKKGAKSGSSSSSVWVDLMSGHSYDRNRKSRRRPSTDSSDELDSDLGWTSDDSGDSSSEHSVAQTNMNRVYPQFIIPGLLNPEQEVELQQDFIDQSIEPPFHAGFPAGSRSAQKSIRGRGGAVAKGRASQPPTQFKSNGVVQQPNQLSSTTKSKNQKGQTVAEKSIQKRAPVESPAVESAANGSQRSKAGAAKSAVKPPVLLWGQGGTHVPVTILLPTQTPAQHTKTNKKQGNKQVGAPLDSKLESALLATGSSYSLLHSCVVEELRRLCPSLQLSAWTGPLPNPGDMYFPKTIRGLITLNLQVGGVSKAQTFWVTDSLVLRMILGVDFCSSFKVVLVGGSSIECGGQVVSCCPREVSDASYIVNQKKPNAANAPQAKQQQKQKQKQKQQPKTVQSSPVATDLSTAVTPLSKSAKRREAKKAKKAALKQFVESAQSSVQEGKAIGNPDAVLGLGSSSGSKPVQDLMQQEPVVGGGIVKKEKGAFKMQYLELTQLTNQLAQGSLCIKEEKVKKGRWTVAVTVGGRIVATATDQLVEAKRDAYAKAVTNLKRMVFEQQVPASL